MATPSNMTPLVISLLGLPVPSERLRYITRSHGFNYAWTPNGLNITSHYGPKWCARYHTYWSGDKKYILPDISFDKRVGNYVILIFCIGGDGYDNRHRADGPAEIKYRINSTMVVFCRYGKTVDYRIDPGDYRHLFNQNEIYNAAK